MTAGALLVAFVLELAALAALAWWGAEKGGVLLGVAAPTLGAVVWGLFAAPKRRFHLGQGPRYVAKFVVFGAATAALVAVGHPALALGFAVVVVIDLVALGVLEDTDGLDR